MDTDYRIDTIAKIMDCGLTATEKVVTTKLFLHAWQHEPEAIPDTTELYSDVIMLPGMSGKALGKLTGVHESTANGAVKKLAEYKVIGREVTHQVIDRNGNQVPPQSMDPRQGHHWESYTTLTLPLELRIENLPPKPQIAPTQRQAAAKEAWKTNHELQNIGRLLKEFECPHCHTKGLMALQCHNCGATWTTEDAITGGEPSYFAEIPESTMCTLRENPPEIEKTERTFSDTRDFRVTESGTKRGDISASVAIVNTPSVTEPTNPPVSPLTTTQDVVPADEPGAPLSAIDSTPADLATDPLPDYHVVLIGKDTVRFFDELDAAFCLVEPKGKKAINTRDDWGDELSWVDTPITGAAAEMHLARGGNVGILTGRGQIGLIDVDNDLAGFLARYPLMATLPRITRDNAPDRAKLLIILADDTIRSHTYKGSLHKLELLALGNQGVIAGVHESGATIRLTIGDLVQFTQDKLDAMAREWTGTTREITPTVKRALQSRPADASFVRDVFRWANQQPCYQAEARQLLAACRHQGAYVAVRPDDRTPSAKLDHDAYAEQYGPTLHDFGTGEKWDVCETISRLRPIDKRALLWDELVPEYRRAQR